MRFFKSVLMCIVLLLGVQTLEAQIGSSRRGQQGYGSPQGNNITYEPSKPDAGERAQLNVNLYAEELGIDAFKKEVLKNYLKDYYTEKFDIMYSETLPPNEKQAKLDVAKVKFEKQMAPVFTEETMNQILAFEDIGAKRILKEKKKRKKKRKKTKKG